MIDVSLVFCPLLKSSKLDALVTVQSSSPVLNSLSSDKDPAKDPWISVKRGVGYNVKDCISSLKLSKVFEPGLGLVKDLEARLVLKDGSKPIFLKHRTLPYALREPVEKELTEMVKSDILTKTEDSKWGTPIVPVVKGQKVRICGDYKSTLNKVLEVKQYPLPSTEDCFNSVTGGEKFSVIDIKQAYNNVLIREEDRELTTLSTHRGLYTWKRLPYGISSSAAIFQSIMDDTLKDIPMTCCRIDDILSSGKNDLDHLRNLKEVFDRLERRGFKCKLEKTQFMKDSVIYLGHKVSKLGISPVNSKVEDLLAVEPPKNVKELVAFLGAVGYYRCYLPNLSTVIAPLDRLRSKDTKWQWTKTEQKAFEELRSMLTSDIEYSHSTTQIYR